MKDGFPFSAASAGDLLYVSANLNGRGQPVLQVTKLAGGAYIGFFYEDGVRFAVRRDGREIWGDWPDDYSVEDAATYLVGPVIAFVLRLRGITCLHASAVAIDNNAIAVLGSAGAGKSTTAAAFALRGFPVLSDDVVALDDRGSRFLVQPGYPRVNLWPDSVRALFGSEDALPRITPTWEKRFLGLDQNGYRFQSEPLPLAAIYVLEAPDATVNATRMEERSGNEALLTLVANTYVNYLLDSEMRRRDFEVLGRLLTQVPVRSLKRRVASAQPLDLCDAIAQDAERLTVSLGAARSAAAARTNQE